MCNVPTLLAFTALVFGIGCRSQQLACDQDHIRNAVMDLHTNQIMDNLIRARKGLPILQLDYVHMTGTVTDTGSATAGSTYTTARSVARTLTNIFTFSATGTQVNQLTITAEPVTTAPEVYNAYLAFLKDPNHLVETARPPPPDGALIVRTCAPGCNSGMCAPKWYQPKIYYWVPCVYRDEFFKLALFTVSLRGQPVAISQDFDVTITGFDPDSFTPDAAGTYRLKFTIDKKIPNDNGYLIATIKGINFGIGGLQILYPGTNPAVPGQTLTESQQSSEFQLVFNPAQLGLPPGVNLEVKDIVQDLAGKKVGIRLRNFAPSGSATDRLLENVRSQLELNRLNQFQLIPVR